MNQKDFRKNAHAKFNVITLAIIKILELCLMQLGYSFSWDDKSPNCFWFEHGSDSRNVKHYECWVKHKSPESGGLFEQWILMYPFNFNQDRSKNDYLCAEFKLTEGAHAIDVVSSIRTSLQRVPGN